MGRRKGISGELDTDLHRSVSPVWEPPETVEGKVHQRTIDPKFQEAAKALASWNPGLTDWDRDSWARHPSNVYFMLRSVLINLAKAWQSTNWERVAEQHNLQRKLQVARRTMEDAMRSMLLAFEECPESPEPQNLARAFLSNCNLGGEACGADKITRDQATEALCSYLEDLRARMARPIWTDFIEWRSLPMRLPRAETIAGLTFANELIRWRGYPKDKPSVQYPVVMADPATAKRNMPWNAIALFVNAALDAEEDENSMRAKVLKIWPKVARYHQP